ncbi:MAG: glycyl-radical enzyme activating protein [Clostridia bacterium]|nr:glycyl-radical enzyme activating protein [Clostridia bacterium]
MENIYDRSGRIFNIQRFSIHDGPGIRTIVFFKGCYLRCRWCCNPESQEYNIQEMKTNGVVKTVGQDITVRELLAELEKDRIYYDRSDGGITLSGGEPMAQPEFAEALLRACHSVGFNTAIETTACAKREVVERLIPHIDHVMMDIKHINSAKHLEFTNQPNEQILSNAKWIAENASHFVIRVPVIPTFNDTPQEIADIARFAASLTGVKELHLLPYHRLGQDKYKGLGREYLLSDILPLSASKIAELKASAERAAGNLRVQIGG